MLRFLHSLLRLHQFCYVKQFSCALLSLEVSAEQVLDFVQASLGKLFSVASGFMLLFLAPLACAKDMVYWILDQNVIQGQLQANALDTLFLPMFYSIVLVTAFINVVVVASFLTTRESDK